MEAIEQQTDSSAGLILSADSAYTLSYYKASAAFENGRYTRAESGFRLAFKIKPGEEAARFLYYSLLYQGLDLEAGAFQRKNPDFTFALPPAQRGLESIYTDAGMRASSNGNAGNIYYGDVGITLRPRSGIRVWSAASFLQHDSRANQYQQYQYFAALNWFTGSGWYVMPALHYAYVPYRLRQQEQSPFSYSNEFDIGPGDPITNITNGTQVTTATSPGRSHYLNGALHLHKRIGALSLEIEPALHHITGRSDILVAYTSTGTTTSTQRGDTISSKPYAEAGTSIGDTSYRSVHGQAGLGLGYRFLVFGQPLTIRATVFGLTNGASRIATAYHASATLWYKSAFRLYASWLRKGDAPLALHVEGLYFNYFDRIETRATTTFQLFPLRNLSPAITYQYERGTRIVDGAKLLYHSFYVTLKYNL